MHSDILTIGDLFEEDNFSWVNDEEAMAFSKIEELIYQFKIDYGKKPTTIYVSDSEELQSYLLWFAKSYGLVAVRTKKITYVQ